jgi:hypothetical protein
MEVVMLIKPVALINFPGGLLSDWTMDKVGAYIHTRVRVWQQWDHSSLSGLSCCRDARHRVMPPQPYRHHDRPAPQHANSFRISGRHLPAHVFERCRRIMTMA